MRSSRRFLLMGSEAKPLPVPPADLIMCRTKIVGSREYLYEALDHAAKGKVKIAETHPLGQVNEAYDRVAHGKVRFRAVIVNRAQ